MMSTKSTRVVQGLAVCFTVAGLIQLLGAAPQFGGPQGGPPQGGRGGGFGGAPQDRDQKIVAQFDKDGDKRLNEAERQAALAYVLAQGNGRGGRIKLEVVALLANSMLQGDLLVSEANFLKLFPHVSGYRAFLVAVPTQGEGEADAADDATIVAALRSCW